jgi:isochorismate synthase
VNTTIAKGYSSLAFSKAIWQNALQYQYQIAFWRLPHTGTVHLMIDFSDKAAATRIDLEELPAGFAFSPFLNDDGDSSLFIRGDVYYTIKDVQQFMRLCARYPHAFVSLVYTPKAGIWMGASPETLINVDEHGIFRTVSLAGTQKLSDQTPVSQAVWRQKEIEEQALVSRYIVNCFKKIRLREYEEVGPRTVAAGNLMHLQTDFTVNTQEVNFPQLGTVMLQLLHPTSAVCGMPKEPALQFLQDHEKHSRAFYSGFLGPVNVASKTHIFVNLRCMQLQANKAVLYAGAGITADSDPQKEWAETELKCRTLLDVFNQD